MMRMVNAVTNQTEIVSMNFLDVELEKLNEDHTELKVQLLELYGMAKAIGWDVDCLNWSGAIDNLCRKLDVFIAALDEHSDWEENVLFPKFAGLTGEHMRQLTEMEKEHELVEQSIRRFLDKTEGLCAPVRRQEAMEAAACLLDAYMVLSDHFRKEEEILFPLVHEMAETAERFMM